MLVRSLKNQNQFDSVNHFGYKINSRNFLLVLANNSSFLPDSAPNIVFLGMKVGKKLSKKAVTRNKIKRRIRHLIKLVFKQLAHSASPPIALIVIPKKGFENHPFRGLEKELYQCLNKASRNP